MKGPDQTKKEALFNEVKGSLFEYLIARKLALKNQAELTFLESLDKNYLTVLSQQDRMIRQFYPEMLPFLNAASESSASQLITYLQNIPSAPRVVGKFSNSELSSELFEADLLIDVDKKTIPVSLKLNKKNAFVNTKSGGIKSFFLNYFSFLDSTIQEEFNKFVDMEFNRMALDLHALEDLDYQGNFEEWVKKGLSELPGELAESSRAVLKGYYARIAHRMHEILSDAMSSHPENFRDSLPPLLGFGSKDILQLIYFHEFPENKNPIIDIHSFDELKSELPKTLIKSFHDTSSVEIEIGRWNLQIRVKPMNKFTTTAIKINCSVRIRPPSGV